MSTVADNQSRLTQAIADYMRRVDAGEAVQRDQFLEVNSDVAADLNRYLENVALVEQMAGPTPVEQSQSSTQEAARRETVSASQGGDSVPEKKATVADGPLTGIFGRYKIERTLGEGAMGTVYLARDTELDRRVALKVPKFKDDDAEMMERFYREARSAARLQHRHICPVHDIGEIDGIKYISIAYISGHPLSAYVSPDKPQSERNVAVIVRKLALALDTAHREGVIHRDLKPANVMVDKKTEPVIMDFGLAREINKQEDNRLTQTGTIMGSPAYMSPEQVNADNEKIGPCSDIYSLGVILYELLTGHLPFEGSVAAVIGQILMAEPDKPSTYRPDLDPRLEAVCAKMMAKQIDERYASMRDVADALTSFLKNPTKNGEKRSVGKLESFAPVELKEAAKESKRGRRTVARERSTPQPAETFASGDKASGGRQPADASSPLTAFDRLKHLPRKTKAIVGGLAGLVLLLGITIIIKVGNRTVEVSTDKTDLEVEAGGVNVKAASTGVSLPVPAKPANQSAYAATSTTGPIALTADNVTYDAVMKGEWQPVFAAAADVPQDGGVSFQEGELTLNSRGLPIPGLRARNVAVRARVKKESGRGFAIHVRVDPPPDQQVLTTESWRSDCTFWLEGAKQATGINCLFNGRRTARTGGTLKREGPYVDVMVVAIGDRFLLFEDGNPILDYREGELAGAGAVIFQAYQSRFQVRDIAVQVLPETELPASPALVKTNEFFANMDPVRFSRDGRHILGIHWGDFRLAVFDPVTGKLVRKSDQGWDSMENGGWATALAVSPVGSLVAGGSSKGRLLLWDYDTGKLLHDLKGHTKAVLQAAFTLDGRRLLSTSNDGSLRVWNVETGREERQLDGGDVPRGVFALAVSPDGQHFADGKDRKLRYRNLQTGKVLWRVSMPPRSEVRESAFSRDGSSLAEYTIGPDWRLAIHDAKDGHVIRTMTGLPASLHVADSLRFTANDQMLVSAHPGAATDLSAGTLIWDVASGQLLQQIDNAGAADVSPDGKTIVTKGPEMLVRIWRPSETTVTQVKPELVAALKGDDHSFTGVAFTPDGNRVVAAGFSGQIWQWDTKSGAVISQMKTKSVDVMALAPDGKMLATAHRLPDAITLWDLDKQQEIHRLVSKSGKNQYHTSIAFAPDGTTVAAIAADSIARIWDVVTGRQLHAFPVRHKAELFADKRSGIAYSPDGRFVLARSAAQDAHRVYVFDLSNGTIDESLSFDVKSPTFGPFAMSLDGKELALSALDESPQLVDWRGNRPPQTIRCSGGQRSVGYSPDSRFIAIGSLEKFVLFDRNTREQVAELKLQDKPVQAGTVAFSPDGRFLAAAEKFNRGQNPPATPPSEFYVRIWRLTPTPPALPQPALPAINQWVNIIPDIDVIRDALASEWSKSGSELRLLSGVQENYLRLPTDLSESYEIEMSFTRHVVPREHGVALLLPFGDRRARATFSGWNTQHVSGLSVVNGIYAGDAKSPCRSVAFKIVAGQRHDIRLRVVVKNGQANFSATADGKPLLAWEGPVTQLDHVTPLPNRNPLLSCFDNGKTTFHAIRWRNLGSAADEAEVPKKRWLRPKVNSDEIKRLLVFNLNKGNFGRPPNIKLMEKFTLDEVAERKADGRMGSKGKFEYRFNKAGKIIFESVSDSPILPSVPRRRRGGGKSDLGDLGGGDLSGRSPPKK